MAWTNEAILDKLGDEAQVVPGAIMVFRGKHIVVAELTIGGGLVVTPEGFELLGEPTVPEAKPSKKPRKAVESANVLAVEHDDLDLEE